jgi:hypothetical protein
MKTYQDMLNETDQCCHYENFQRCKNRIIFKDLVCCVDHMTKDTMIILYNNLRKDVDKLLLENQKRNH